MKKRFSLEEAAKISRISHKDILTYIRRGFFSSQTKLPLGDRKHDYFFSEEEIAFMAIFGRLVRALRINYKFASRWKKEILCALNSGHKFCTISLNEINGIRAFSWGSTDRPVLLSGQIQIIIELETIRKEIREIVE